MLAGVCPDAHPDRTWSCGHGCVRPCRFLPERFVQPGNEALAPSNPHAYVPFGLGARCAPLCPPCHGCDSVRGVREHNQLRPRAHGSARAAWHADDGLTAGALPPRDAVRPQELHWLQVCADGGAPGHRAHAAGLPLPAGGGQGLPAHQPQLGHRVLGAPRLGVRREEGELSTPGRMLCLGASCASPCLYTVESPACARGLQLVSLASHCGEWGRAIRALGVLCRMLVPVAHGEEQE